MVIDGISFEKVCSKNGESVFCFSYQVRDAQIVKDKSGQKVVNQIYIDDTPYKGRGKQKGMYHQFGVVGEELNYSIRHDTYVRLQALATALRGELRA